ncbi:Putative colanic biosynthesis UDP-glucose lipid carrier transferase [Chlamydia trachomatis]|nr:Putative colanic biosynthesis UDP-glucose lipid carrier transferase [Chlamydia trachomatis]
MGKKKLKKAFGISCIVAGATFVGLNVLAKKKQPDSVYANDLEEQNPLEGKRVIFVEDDSYKENADGVKGYLKEIGECNCRPTLYDKYIKRSMDVILSFGGLVFLSPIMAAIALAIKVEDPGPVLFTQKRMGQNKRYFKLHKFRSMKMDTPHDVPTHQLENPDQYITKVGKFIRAHSLDELPQIWDIFIGNMSVIGPRPGLWNQDLLTAERDKYNANDIKPGLTGWAQINGRDELEIPVKARLDGEYVKNESLLFDAKCFLGTVSKVGHDDSVVEGGTGEMNKQIGRNYTENKSDEELIGQLGFGEPVTVDLDKKVKVLIVGKGSYIGESFTNYAKEHYKDNFEIDSVDTINPGWKDMDFSKYDIVYHVAGIAHADVGNVSDEIKEKYYKVNTDLTIEVANKAKNEGVKEFIFMSSMIVYGDSAPYGTTKIVDRNTIPSPANFYGDSKLQADVAVRDLADDNFKVIVLRPPMIYGKGSKGNYPLLAKLAKTSPIFPNIDNERSMLHIDNLCEFLCQIMLVDIKQNATVLIPQNSEWTKTSDMVREIAKVSNTKTIVTKLFNPCVYIAHKISGKINGLVDKAFGNNCYDLEMSKYEGLNYQIISLNESIRKTERETLKKKILFLVNHDVVIYNFRLELVEKLLTEGYEVHISSPYGERIDDLKKLGAIHHDIKMDRHGMNPISEFKLLNQYKKLISELKPDYIFGYTIKPNIYGSIAAQKYNVPFIANITGLGTAVENPGMTQKIMVMLYKIAFKDVEKVFFQNTENQEFFVKHKIALGKHELLPGSGVNLQRFSFKEYPKGNIIKFAFISRIMKEKGIDQYLEAAKSIKEKYNNVEFHICGFCEAEYEGKLKEYNDNGIVIYHGMIRDVADFMSKMNCIVHPTYYPEGISNVLLEACATGRPIITTNRSGCREVIDDGVNGYMIPQKNTDKLIESIDKFLHLKINEMSQMGLKAREKVEKEFDRQIVVDAYMNQIKLNGEL